MVFQQGTWPYFRRIWSCLLQNSELVLITELDGRLSFEVKLNVQVRWSIQLSLLKQRVNPFSTGQSKIGRRRPIKFRQPLRAYFSTDLYKNDIAGMVSSLSKRTTLAKKIVTAEIFMRLIRTAIMWYHARSTSICNASSRRVEPRVASMSNPSLISHDFTWLDCRINLMNFSAVTIFLARVVDTLILKIGQEMTTLQLFEVTQLVDFGTIDRRTWLTAATSLTALLW